MICDNNRLYILWLELCTNSTIVSQLCTPEKLFGSVKLTCSAALHTVSLLLILVLQPTYVDIWLPGTMWQIVTIVPQHLLWVMEPSSTQSGGRLGIGSPPSQRFVQVPRKGSRSFIYGQSPVQEHLCVGRGASEVTHFWQCGHGRIWNTSGTKVWVTGGDSLRPMNTDMDICRVPWQTVTRTGNTVGQVAQSLTHIPMFVPCNPERKHCSAHSLTGWSDGSRKRAGHKWSQCQRTVSGRIYSHRNSTCAWRLCVGKSMTLR